MTETILIYTDRRGHVTAGEPVAAGQELVTIHGNLILPHGAELRPASAAEAREFRAACAVRREGLAAWYEKRPHVCD